MDEKVEAFREEVLQWRGTRRKGARPYTAVMKAKALQRNRPVLDVLPKAVPLE
jgi:hypothetical protein